MIKKLSARMVFDVLLGVFAISAALVLPTIWDAPRAVVGILGILFIEAIVMLCSVVVLADAFAQYMKRKTRLATDHSIVKLGQKMDRLLRAVEAIEAELDGNRPTSSSGTNKARVRDAEYSSILGRLQLAEQRLVAAYESISITQDDEFNSLTEWQAERQKETLIWRERTERRLGEISSKLSKRSSSGRENGAFFRRKLQAIRELG